MARHIDFDAVWAEITENATAPTVTVHGGTITLPLDKPMALVLLEQRLRDPDKRAGVTIVEAVDVLSIVAGPEVVQGWIDAGAGATQLTLAVATIGAAWRPAAADDTEVTDER